MHFFWITQGEKLHDTRMTPGTEYMEALAEFSAGAGHEINNPLATILGRVQLLQQDETDPDRLQSLATIGAQAIRIRDMISDVMLFARPNQPDKKAVNAARICRESIANIVRNTESEINVETDLEDSVELDADARQLGIVFDELLRNSLEAIDGSGVIHVRITRQNDVAAIEITDNGRGFTASMLSHLFDPFFSGRQAGRGLGFGLCKCWRIVTLHNGKIEVDSDPSGGRTCVSITWPLANPISEPV